MDTSHKRTFIASVVLAAMIYSAATADDHIIFQRIRSGLGVRFPARSTEIWMNESSVWLKGSAYVTIERYDLQKRWIVSPGKKRYVEVPLTPAPEKKINNDSVAIQRAGWTYAPTYEWTVKETDQEAVIGDQPCMLIVAEGDADYSSESVELWVAKSAPVNAALYNERVTAGAVDFDWQDLLNVFPTLKNRFIMRFVDKRRPPIAPETTYETKITKVETAAPPPMIYEVPDGFQRVNSVQELSN